MKYTHIIWDFNGTILDDVSVGIDAINVMLSSRRMKTIDSIDEYRELFGFPIKDYYARVGFDFEIEDYEQVLAPEWVREYNLREGCAHMCDGVLDALRMFREIGVRQSIISASGIQMLESQIDRLGIKGFFDNIIGCDNYFAYGKSELCVQYVHSRPQDTFILIGDSTHDYDVATAAGVDCVLVLSGHMNRATLQQCGCPIYDNAYMAAKAIINDCSER